MYTPACIMEGCRQPKKEGERPVHTACLQEHWYLQDLSILKMYNLIVDAESLIVGFAGAVMLFQI